MLPGQESGGGNGGGRGFPSGEGDGWLHRRGVVLPPSLPPPSLPSSQPNLGEEGLRDPKEAEDVDGEDFFHLGKGVVFQGSHPRHACVVYQADEWQRVVGFGSAGGEVFQDGTPGGLHAVVFGHVHGNGQEVRQMEGGNGFGVSHCRKEGGNGARQGRDKDEKEGGREGGKEGGKEGGRERSGEEGPRQDRFRE